MDAYEWAWTRLVEQARELGPDPELVGVSDALLEEQVRTGAARIAALTCVWLGQVAEFVVRGGWAEDGARTPGQWLSWACGVAPGTAREYVRVGLALRGLPVLRARFATGTVSYSKVRALTRVATAETEAALVQLADQAPAAELERIVSIGRRQALRERAVEEPGPDDGEVRGWRRVQVDVEVVEFRVRMGVADAAAFEERMDRLVDVADRERQRQQVGQSELGEPDEVGGDVEPVGLDLVRPRAVRRVEALADAVATAVGAGGPDRSGVDDHLVVLHVDVADLVDDVSAETDPGDVSPKTSGGDVSAGTSRSRRVVTGRGRPVVMRHAVLRRLTCDVEVVLVPEGDAAHPGDIGRRSRTVPRRLRRALQLRDRGCRFPGCGRTRGLHAHHVVHWADGGPTTLGNLVLLCGFHHRFVHDRGWELRPLPGIVGRWSFHRPGSDQPVPEALLLPGASAETSGCEPDPRSLQPPWWDGEPWDLAEACTIVADWINHRRPAEPFDPGRYMGFVAT